MTSFTLVFEIHRKEQSQVTILKSTYDSYEEVKLAIDSIRSGDYIDLHYIITNAKVTPAVNDTMCKSMFKVDKIIHSVTVEKVISLFVTRKSIKFVLTEE